jgi:hypothetical protein
MLLGLALFKPGRMVERVPPVLEAGTDALHAMVSIEQSCHRIEQVLVLVQVFLILN